MSELLHYGRPAANVGCAHTDGTPMWDAAAARAEAWEDSQAAGMTDYVKINKRIYFSRRSK